MTVWQLFRALLAHILRGRGGDTVGIAVSWDTEEGEDFVTGNVREFRWEGDADALAMIDAFTDRPEHLTAPRTTERVAAVADAMREWLEDSRDKVLRNVSGAHAVALHKSWVELELALGREVPESDRQAAQHAAAWLSGGANRP